MNNALPLAGIRVLEFCHTIMGPSAGLILAKIGEDNIQKPRVANRLKSSPDFCRLAGPSKRPWTLT